MSWEFLVKGNQFPPPVTIMVPPSVLRKERPVLRRQTKLTIGDFRFLPLAGGSDFCGFVVVAARQMDLFGKYEQPNLQFLDAQLTNVDAMARFLMKSYSPTDGLKLHTRSIRESFYDTWEDRCFQCPPGCELHQLPDLFDDPEDD